MRKTITKQTLVCCLQALLVLSGLQMLSSCVNEEYPSEDGQQVSTKVKFNMSSRGGIPGTDSEIKTLRIIAFDSRNGGKVYNDVIGTVPETIEMLSGMRDFYFIANEPSSKTAALSAVNTLDALRNIHILSGELSTGNTFVAFGSLTNTVIKPQVLNTIYVDDLKRLAVKIKLKLRGKNFITPQGVFFKNLPDAVPLFESTYVASTPRQVSVPIADFSNITPLPSGYIWAIHNDEIIVPSSLFTPVTDESKASIIEVKLSDTKTVKGKLCRTSVADGTKDYTLPRNVEYTLVCNVGADKLDIEASIANWDLKDQDYPAGGGSFWNAQPQSVRVGLDGTVAERTAVFTAKISSNASVSYEWYHKSQNSDMSYTTELLTNDVNGITINQGSDNTSTLTIVASKLDNSGEIYCKGITTSPDGKQESLESTHATLMVVGTQTSIAGEYPDMQNWVTPRNALLGATCLLRDSRDSKIYRVKLMIDGNWWMVQDLSYGNVISVSDFDDNCDNKGVTNLIGTGLFGVAKQSDLSTGGFLYNRYAAIQLPQGTSDDNTNNLALKSEYLPSLCPAGWHLPGNIKSSPNKEWHTLQQLINQDVTTPVYWLKYDYNNSMHINAYDMIETINASGEFVNAVAFHGGYISGIVDRRLLFSGMGFVTTSFEKGAVLDLATLIPATYGVPIRCIRNPSNK